MIPAMAEYAQPDVLVDTAWVEAHLQDPQIRLVEVDVDTEAYELGHVPGALAWNWSRELCDVEIRDILPKSRFEALMRRSGIGKDTTIVLYGDNNNWFAAWALWQLKIYGHADVRIMNGGRTKWIADGRPVDFEAPSVAPSDYVADDPDVSLRALLPQVRDAVAQKSANLVDVRSELEYTGELLAPPGLPETCQRGGHIPGAVSVPWGKVCREDGTFLPADELASLYGAQGVDGSRPSIAYCRIGERSSHTWFVLKYLLGHDRVTNYDGSWTEWGNLVGAPVARGTAP